MMRDDTGGSAVKAPSRPDTFVSVGSSAHGLPGEASVDLRNASASARNQYEHALRQLVMRAAERYRSSGRSPYYFARGKLGGDPVFAALLRDGRIRDGARIVDIGCGLGVLAAWLAAAETCDPGQATEWPQAWAKPPKHWTMRGFDLRNDAVAAGQRALSDLGDRVSLNVGDARRITLPACDAIVLLDVLHYMDRDEQQTLLKRTYEALDPCGVLLLRVGDITTNSRSRFTLIVDWCVTMLRDRRWPRLHCRTLGEWKLLLESIGYSVSAQPMSEGTLFANVLLIASKHADPDGRRDPFDRSHLR